MSIAHLHQVRRAAAGIALVAMTGCGKPPPAQQGPPEGDFPVSAVVARASVEPVVDEVVLVASLDAKRDVSIVSELDATLTDVAFAEGQAVQEGDVLFRFDPTATEARLQEAEAAYRLAKVSYDRNQALLANQTISQQEYDQSESNYYQRKAELALARDEWDKIEIEAPFAGVVGEREISAGQFVRSGQVLTRLLQIDPLEIVFDVPERYLSKLQLGLTVAFAADAYPGERFSGRVVYIAPEVDRRSRTVRVKADVENRDRRLRPGLFGELSLELNRREAAVVIPEAAVHFADGKTQVVKVTAEGKSAVQPVQVGNRFKGRAEITEGLSGGTMVVVEGYQKMGPGMTVHAAPESERYGVSPGSLSATAGASSTAEGSHAIL